MNVIVLDLLGKHVRRTSFMRPKPSSLWDHHVIPCNFRLSFYSGIYSVYSWFFLINLMKTGIGQSKYCILPRPFSGYLISLCGSLSFLTLILIMIIIKISKSGQVPDNRRVDLTLARYKSSLCSFWLCGSLWLDIPLTHRLVSISPQFETQAIVRLAFFDPLNVSRKETFVQRGKWQCEGGEQELLQLQSWKPSDMLILPVWKEATSPLTNSVK